jgi:hypothetical protein
VPGPNYPEALVQLYNQEMDHIQNNYRLIGQLDPALLKEFEVSPKKIMACLKARLSGLKHTYWHELFSHMSAITDRLTSGSRKSLLGKLHRHASVDFTVPNILEVVVWVIKNANHYIESQLIETYELMVDKCNVQLYKSNQKTWVDNGWRYGQGETINTHYALDYRIVTHRIGGIRVDYSGQEIEERAADFIGDHGPVPSLLSRAQRVGSGSMPLVHVQARRGTRHPLRCARFQKRQPASAVAPEVHPRIERGARPAEGLAAIPQGSRRRTARPQCRPVFQDQHPTPARQQPTLTHMNTLQQRIQ